MLSKRSGEPLRSDCNCIVNRRNTNELEVRAWRLRVKSDLHHYRPDCINEHFGFESRETVSRFAALCKPSKGGYAVSIISPDVLTLEAVCCKKYPPTCGPIGSSRLFVAASEQRSGVPHVPQPHKSAHPLSEFSCACYLRAVPIAGQNLD